MTDRRVLVDSDVWPEFYRKRTGEPSREVQELLSAFPDEAVSEREYELAAEPFNTCRSRGVQGSSTDFLICACSAAWTMPVLTRDQDYGRYAEHVPVRVYALPSA